MNRMPQGTTRAGAAASGARVMGIRVDPVDYAGVLDRVAGWVNEGRRPPAVIMQTNVFSCVTALDDPLYRNALNAADLSVPDGMPLVWMSRRQGYPIGDRVYGPEMMLRMAALGAGKGWRVFLYGGEEGVAPALGRSLEERFPGLRVAGWITPPHRALTAEEDAEYCRRINEADPDIVWVALGGPKQDRWMMEHRERLSASVLHGVGAAFDFLTGRVSQAPRWMQSRGLEWAYRLYREPRRLWKRYLIGNTRFLIHALPEALRAGEARRRSDH